MCHLTEFYLFWSFRDFLIVLIGRYLQMSFKHMHTSSHAHMHPHMHPHIHAHIHPHIHQHMHAHTPRVDDPEKLNMLR